VTFSTNYRFATHETTANLGKPIRAYFLGLLPNSATPAGPEQTGPVALVVHRHNPIVDDHVVIWLDREALAGLGQYELTCVSTKRRRCPIEDCYSIDLGVSCHFNHITLPVGIRQGGSRHGCRRGKKANDHQNDANAFHGLILPDTVDFAQQDPRFPHNRALGTG